MNDEQEITQEQNSAQMIGNQIQYPSAESALMCKDRKEEQNNTGLVRSD